MCRQELPSLFEGSRPCGTPGARLAVRLLTFTFRDKRVDLPSVLLTFYFRRTKVVPRVLPSDVVSPVFWGCAQPLRPVSDDPLPTILVSLVHRRFFPPRAS